MQILFGIWVKKLKNKILYFIHVKFCKHDPYWPEQDPPTNIRYVSMLSNCHILILNRWKAVHLLPCNGNKILTLPRQYSFRHLVACVTKSALYASHSCAFQHLPLPHLSHVHDQPQGQGAPTPSHNVAKSIVLIIPEMEIEELTTEPEAWYYKDMETRPFVSS